MQDNKPAFTNHTPTESTANEPSSTILTLDADDIGTVAFDFFLRHFKQTRWGRRLMRASKRLRAHSLICVVAQTICRWACALVINAFL
jgi:hypothetical protein